jgi:hypothetical protein
VSQFNHPEGAGVPTPTAFNHDNSRFHFDNFAINNYGSFSYIRFIAAIGASTTRITTSNAQTTYWHSAWTTMQIGIFSRGTGANSDNLLNYTSTTAGVTQIWQAEATASQWSRTLLLTLPATSTPLTYSLTSAVSSASIVFSEVRLGLAYIPVTATVHFMDIPFEFSLSPGNYWMCFGLNTTGSTNVVSAIGNAGIRIALYGNTNMTRGRILGTNDLLSPIFGNGMNDNATGTAMKTIVATADISQDSNNERRFIWSAFRVA